MNILLWILQTLLAALYLWHGMLFLSPPADLAEIMDRELALWFRLFLGTAEVAAAVGLILPGLIRVLPKLIPLTAAGLTVVMTCATVLHSQKGETGSAVTTAVLFAILAFVGYMR